MTAGTVAREKDISILHRALIPSGTSKAMPSYGLPKYTSDILETRLKGISPLEKRTVRAALIASAACVSLAPGGLKFIVADAPAAAFIIRNFFEYSNWHTTCS
jgi:hypothetical protein